MKPQGGGNVEYPNETDGNLLPMDPTTCCCVHGLKRSVIAYPNEAI